MILRLDTAVLSFFFVGGSTKVPLLIVEVRGEPSRAGWCSCAKVEPLRMGEGEPGRGGAAEEVICGVGEDLEEERERVVIWRMGARAKTECRVVEFCGRVQRQPLRHRVGSKEKRTKKAVVPVNENGLFAGI